MNDSVDELKSRIAKLDKSIQDMQTQLQTPQTLPAGVAPVTPPGAEPTAPPPTGDASAAAAAPATAATTTVQAPPLKETYQAGVRDYNAARYDVAAGEFQDVLHYYPLDDLAGNANFYLGEIAYREKNYADAIKSYNAVLEGFSGSAKAPAAQLAQRIGPAAGGQEGCRHSRVCACSSSAIRRLLKPPRPRPSSMLSVQDLPENRTIKRTFEHRDATLNEGRG